VITDSPLNIVSGGPLKANMCPVLSIHLDSVEVRIVRIISIINKNNDVIEENPEAVHKTQIGIVELVAQRPFAAETIHTIPKLSRFVIKINQVIAAVGFIRAVL
jgi:translation elongation factor EF-1alpha